MQDATAFGKLSRQRIRIILLLLVLVIEGLMFLMALSWAHWRGIALWTQIRFDPGAFGWIAGATIVVGIINIGAYGLALRRQVHAVVHFDHLVVPIFGASAAPDLLCMSLLAGIAEEVMFRGVLQAEIGIIGAGLLFGLMHYVQRNLWFYTIWAALVGVLFGYLYYWTGNLLVPIAVHAAYDFIALVYIRYWRAPHVREGT